VFTWDLFTFRRKRFTPDPTVNKMFLGRKLNKVPARTYGRLSRDEQGRLVLKYRPWLVLPERTLTLPEGKYVVGKGAIFSEIQQQDGDDVHTAMLLPPRYHTHEDKLVPIYNLIGVRYIGLRAAWQWLKESVGLKAQPVAA